MIRDRARALMRAAATAWLLVAVVLLVVTLLRPEMQAAERTALASLVPLYFLSFPLGHVGVMALSRLKLELYAGSGYTLGMHEEGLLLWIALTLLGWLQWFVLLPGLARKARQATDFLFKRFFAR
jgi:hypothetical protein